jgi:hypothetical protein
MTMLEPTTTITDLILALMSFYFGHMLYRVHSKVYNRDSIDKRYHQFWGIFFLFLGISSLLGAIAHGFPHMAKQYPMIVKAWPFTVMNLGMASFYLFLTIAMEYFPRRRNILFFIAYIKMLVFLLLMFGYPKKYFGDFLNVSFALVLFDYGPILLLLLIMNTWEYIKTKKVAARTMMMAVLICLIATAVQISKFALHPQFNHNDLYHVISMISIYYMYRAVTLKKIG